MGTAADRPLVYWLGVHFPLDWGEQLGRIERCASLRCVPSDAQLILLGGDEQSLLTSLPEARSRSPRAQLVALIDRPPQDEAGLLSAGASLVCVEDCPLTKPRVLALARPLCAPGDPVDRRRRAALKMASEMLGRMADTEMIFDRLIEVISHELNSTRISVLQVNRDEGVLEFRAAIGVPAEVVRTARPPIGKGIAGRCAELGKPLFINDHSAAKQQTELESFTPPDLDLAKLPMSLTVPVLVRGEVVGVVNITDKQDNQPYDKADIQFVSALMGHTAYLLENAALVANLRRLQTFSESILDTIGDPIAVVDGAQQRLISANQQFEAVFGAWRGEDLWGRLKLEAEVQESFVRQLERAEGELQAQAIGERIYDVEFTAFGSTYQDRHLVFLRDVTERRHMEKRLLSAEKLASLGILAAGVAHEINNPISFVKANARHMGGFFDDVLELLDAYRDAAPKDDPRFDSARKAENELDLEDLRGEIAEMVTETIEGVARVEKIVASLKGFAHPDTEKVHRSNLRTLVDNAVLLTTGKWKYKLDVSVISPEDLPLIECVPNQLEQVFMNLVVNAAQAAVEWGTLTIGLEASQTHAIVRFKDSCGGIPADIAEHIFEPFFTTKDIGEGTGLGLSISHNIIEGHGGEIALEVAAGEGSTFTIRLPLGAEGRPIVAQQRSTYRV